MVSWLTVTAIRPYLDFVLYPTRLLMQSLSLSFKQYLI